MLVGLVEAPDLELHAHPPGGSLSRARGLRIATDPNTRAFCFATQSARVRV
jgi:hypothetical protein